MLNWELIWQASDSSLSKELHDLANKLSFAETFLSLIWNWQTNLKEKEEQQNVKKEAGKKMMGGENF